MDFLSFFDFTASEAGMFFLGVTAFVWFAWHDRKYARSKKLVHLASCGDEQAVQLLMHLDMKNGGGVLLVASNQRHWCYGPGGKHHHVISFPSGGFLEFYREKLQERRTEFEDRLRRKSSLIREFGVSGIVSEDDIDKEEQLKWLLEIDLNKIDRVLLQVNRCIKLVPILPKQRPAPRFS